MKKLRFLILPVLLATVYSSCTLRKSIDNPLDIVYAYFNLLPDANQTHQAEVITIDSISIIDSYNDIGTYNAIADHYAWWATSKKNISPTEVLQHYKNGEFHRWKRRRFAQRYNDQHYWFYFKISNQTKTEAELALAFSYKGFTVTLYQAGNDGSCRFIDSNTVHNPIAQRPFHHQALIFPVTVPADTTAAYLVKLQKTTASNILVPIWLIPVKTIYEESVYSRGATYLFFGFFLFMIFFTMLLYFIFREKIYLYQSLYIIATSFYIFNWYNEDSNLLPDCLYVPYSYLPPLLLPLCSTWLMLLIFKEFIVVKSISTRLYKTITGLQWLNISVLAGSVLNGLLFCTVSDSAFMIANKWLQLLAMAFFALFFPVFLVIAIAVFKKVGRTLKIYVGFLMVTIFLWSIQLLNQSGLTNLNFIMDNNLMLALSIEIIVFTFITIYRFFKERAEKVKLLQSQLQLQESFTQSVIESQESERKRIAEELHDGLGGFLTALRFMVNHKKNDFEEKKNTEAETVLTDVQQKLDSAIKDVREISHNLMPTDFTAKAFTDILKDHLHYLNEHGHIRFEFYLDERANKIAQPIQISFFRIASELIRNIQTHSGATAATIQLVAHADHVLLQVEDNGSGFRPGDNKGIGLKNVHSRVNFHNGKINIDSGKLNTTIHIEIPVTYGS